MLQIFSLYGPNPFAFAVGIKSEYFGADLGR